MNSEELVCVDWYLNEQLHDCPEHGHCAAGHAILATQAADPSKYSSYFVTDFNSRYHHPRRRYAVSVAAVAWAAPLPFASAA